MPPISNVAIKFLLGSVRSKMFCLSRFCLLVTTLLCDVGADGGELRPLVGVDPGAELPHAGGGAVQLGALLLVRQHPPGRDHNNNNKLTHHPPQRWSNYAPINMNDFLFSRHTLYDVVGHIICQHICPHDNKHSRDGLRIDVLCSK